MAPGRLIIREVMANSAMTGKKRKVLVQNGIPSKKRKTVVDEEITRSGLNDESSSHNVQKQILEKIEEEFKCNICTEILIRPSLLNCSHMFCEYCITKWKKQQERCPICRDRIYSQGRVLALDAFIEKALKLLTPEEAKAREELINQREQNKSQKPRRSPRLRNRRQTMTEVSPDEILYEHTFPLSALIEVLNLANRFTYD